MNKKVLSQFNEKTVAKVNEMTYMSDLFMSYALKDPEVLKHFIRTCIGDHSIELYSTGTQLHTAEFRSYYDGNYWNRIGGTPESARRISGTTQ